MSVSQQVVNIIWQFIHIHSFRNNCWNNRWNNRWDSGCDYKIPFNIIRFLETDVIKMNKQKAEKINQHQEDIINQYQDWINSPIKIEISYDDNSDELENNIQKIDINYL